MGAAREDDKGTMVDKQWHTEEQVDGTLIGVDVDVHEQEALLLSYCATREIYHEQMWHRILGQRKKPPMRRLTRR